MAKALHLYRAPQRRVVPMEELESVRVIENDGFEGHTHARPNGKRLLLLVVDAETLEWFQLKPGVIRENITTTGIDVNALRVGQRLRIGEGGTGSELVRALPADRSAAAGFASRDGR